MMLSFFSFSNCSLFNVYLPVDNKVVLLYYKYVKWLTNKYIY